MGRAKKESAAVKTRKGRANGHGSLERRPNGTWLARWIANGKRYSQLIRDENGETVTDRRTAEGLLEKITAPYRLSSEAETAALLATKAAGKEAEVKAWHDKQPALALDNGFTVYRSSLKRPQGAGEAALDRYESYYKQFIAWIKTNRPGYKELRDIDRTDANEYARDFLQGGRSGGTFNKHLTLLRSVWTVLAEEDEDKPLQPQGKELPRAKLTCNPWDKIRNREHTPHRKRELTIEELRKVCECAEGEMRALFALGIYTGLRLGDCCLLEWAAIDMQRKMIRAKPRKTKKHGTWVLIPLRPELEAMLATVPVENRTGYVLPETAAQYLRCDITVSNHIQAIFEKCGIKTTTKTSENQKAQVDVGFHSLRHTFVSMLGNAGASLALVQSIVGHTSREMTQHYFHESETALRGAVNLLPNIIDIPTDNAEKTDAGTQDGETDTTTATDDADAPKGNLAAFRAIVEKMTADERKAATKWLSKFNKNNTEAK